MKSQMRVQSSFLRSRNVRWNLLFGRLDLLTPSPTSRYAFSIPKSLFCWLLELVSQTRVSSSTNYICSVATNLWKVNCIHCVSSCLSASFPYVRISKNTISTSLPTCDEWCCKRSSNVPCCYNPDQYCWSFKNCGCRLECRRTARALACSSSSSSCCCTLNDPYPLPFL